MKRGAPVYSAPFPLLADKAPQASMYGTVHGTNASTLRLSEVVRIHIRGAGYGREDNSVLR